MKKYYLTLKKLLQKVSQRFPVLKYLNNNIPESLPKSDHGKRVFFKMASKMATESVKCV